jgi:hypothetical protein
VTEPVTREQFEEWNSEPSLYGIIVMRVARRTLMQRLRRRHGDLISDAAHAVCTKREAVRKAEQIANEMPCVVLLLNLDTQETVDRWITDPGIACVDIKSIRHRIGGD